MKRPYIMAAANGARRGKADHPGLPVTISETVAVAQACQAAGADALHLHVRNANGRHSLVPGIYAEALAELGQAAPGLAVQVSTESTGNFFSGRSVTLPADAETLLGQHFGTEDCPRAEFDCQGL